MNGHSSGGSSSRGPYKGRGRGQGQSGNRGHSSSNGNGTAPGNGPSFRRGYSRGRNDGFVQRNHNSTSGSDIVHAFGLPKLSEYLTLPNDQVITALDRSHQSFKKNLALESPRDELMILLIQIIGEKICGETSLQEIQNRLVALAAEVHFLGKLKDFTLKLPYLTTSAPMSVKSNEVHIDRSHLRILNALSAFYGLLSTRMTAFAADKLVPSIQAAQNTNVILRVGKLLDEGPSLELEQRLMKLLEDLESSKKSEEKPEEKRRRFRQTNQLSPAEVEQLYLINPEDNFWEMEIIPKSEEIIAEEDPFLRPNLVKGKYPSAKTYLDVQFRLLREDFMAPLRESVKEFLNHEAEYSQRKKRLPPGTIRFYHDVKLKKVECLQEMTLYSMQFSTRNLKSVKWEKSKRLLNGSLLLLTPDKFKTIYFATVGRRDEKQLPKGIIDILWEGSNRPKTYVNVSFLMIECEVYFESYRHTLKALQDMAKPAPPLYDKPRLETFRMTKYIVSMTSNPIQPPQYLQNLQSAERLQMDFKMLLKENAPAVQLIQAASKEATEPQDTQEDSNGSLRNMAIPALSPFFGNPLDLREWPTALELGMDQPQYEAFQSAITQEISLIQGPPGTGKTYIGLQIMKLLLANPRVTWSFPPEDPQNNPVPDSDELFEDPFEEAIRRDLLESKLETLYESPILVVCYTNHALDQFLEGIISIMHSLSMDPKGNLVRVGGRSKVEEIQEYNIREINRFYTRNRRFDSNYAVLRNRTRENLLLLQNVRADYKSFFRDLSHPEGIINFKDLLTVKTYNPEIPAIGSVLPEELKEIFLSSSNKLINWLGLSVEDFNSENFRTADLIWKWFGRFQQKPSRNNPVEAQEAEEDEEELEDEEARNILQAHRLEEEIIMEEERKLYKAARLNYLFHYNFHEDFQWKKNKILYEYDAAERNGSQGRMKEAVKELYQCQLEERKYGNQCKFLQEVFSAFQEERIELPEVTDDLLARAHERNPPLRPTMNEKWAVYFWFCEELKAGFLKEVMKLEEEIIKAQENMVQVNNRGDGIILQKAKVVGMTTTGAAKYNTLLRMMKSRIVIVEEAAEVLESHIITSITEHCEQLILIGDHKQLRPPTTVYKLAKDYNLDLSLFERLINNNLHWNYLRAQHRMRPEISKLLVPTIYKDLEDHPSVLYYKAVPGFSKNLFFVTHTQWEKADNDSMTKSNEFEAEYLVKLCRYLMLQGFKAGQVTILTTYIGQMFLIKRLMVQEGDTCRGVRVTVVDNFQGEENDIILLSLVRSNEENRIGFLKTDNRICVALSRAKQGFFIVGNMDCLVKSQSKTWAKISQELEDQGSIGDALKLTCQIHGDLIEIKSPQDFQRKSPEGGCTKMCPGVLPRCNHACQKVCHILDRDHKEYQCKLPCQLNCPEKHPCQYECFQDPCPPCKVIMVRELPCDHIVPLHCYIDYRHYDCLEIVPKKLKCGHVVQIECYVSVENYVCSVRVDKELGCGHVKSLPCHLPIEGYECVVSVDKTLACGHTGWMKCVQDPANFVCNVLSKKVLPCKHEQDVRCSLDVAIVRCQTLLTMRKPDCLHDVEIPCFLSHEPDKWPCKSICDTRLDCGHQCIKPCHLQDDPEHLNYRCRKNCARKCANDLHPCTKDHECYKPCDPCPVLTEKTLPCGHVIKIHCSFDTSSWKCNKPCERQVDCPKGHKCLKKCFEECTPCIAETEKRSIDCGHLVKVKCSEVASRSVCEELVPAAVKSACGHLVEVPCRIQTECTSEDVLKYCRQPCGNIVPTDEDGCGHPCEGDCGSCYQGRIHVKCNKTCGRTLACGHICKFPCASLCPPCEDTCILRCSHSKCKKKCGEPCINCKEWCKWKCEHKKCTRKCGDLCNRDPCNEPCRKKLKCDHDCIGSCGEPCPPQCRLCDQEEVQEILFGDEDEEEARFVFLEDCKHVIHRESMDTWMKTEQNQREVGVKQCPKCKTTITKSVRYGNILKEKLQGVLDVRKKLFGNSELQKRTQDLVANKLQLSQGQEFQFVRDYLENQVFRIERVPTKRGIRIDRHLTKVDQYTFESLDNIVYWWEQAESDVKLKPVPAPRVLPPLRRLDPFTGRMLEVPRQQEQPVVRQDLTAECREDLVRRYNNLFAILLERRLPLSYQEIEDFDQEFERVHDLYRLGLRRGIPNFEGFNGALFMFNSAKSHLEDHRPYDSARKEKTDSLLKDLERIVKAGWDLEVNKKKAERADREKIFKAVGFAGNHWYRCDQGHLYVVADCGALNQAGVCPECRTRVGGGARHVAVRDEGAIRQQIASVVDMFLQQPPPDFSFGEGSNNNNTAGRARGSRGGHRGRRGGRGRNRGSY